MEDHYGIADLRQYTASSRSLFPHPPPDLLSTHPYDGMLMFRSDSAAASSSVAVPPGTCLVGFETGMSVDGGGSGAAGRWPRQETLILLEIRSRLDHKFKEANQKGPLWDEVSRIMSEEHGYQRSGKKCREKFENLYKYYKKTKEGKAGRQDGKHYRFFRQLEALYGDSNTAASASASDQDYFVSGNFHYNVPNKTNSLAINQDSFQVAKLSDTSLSLSNYSDADTSSSDNSDHNERIDDNNDLKNKKRSKRSWKVKIRDFIDLQMKNLMDKQEAWMEKMMTTMEQKEQERILREEEWRKQDVARMDKEQKLWADERAWIEARDAALMEALHKLTGKDQLENDNGSDQTMTNNSAKGGDIWPECEVTSLIQLRAGMEAKFQQRGGGASEEMLWEEIASKMACLGHDRTGLMCKGKWDSINNYLLKCSKTTTDHTLRLHDHGNTNTGNAMSDSCYRYFMGDAFGRIMD